MIEVVQHLADRFCHLPMSLIDPLLPLVSTGAWQPGQSHGWPTREVDGLANESHNVYISRACTTHGRAGAIPQLPLNGPAKRLEDCKDAAVNCTDAPRCTACTFRCVGILGGMPLVLSGNGSKGPLCAGDQRAPNLSLAPSSDPVGPIARASPVMSNRDNQQFDVTRSVDDVVRKAIHDPTSGSP